MQIDIAPETERLVREEIRRGHFRSIDDLIRAGVEALRERKSASAAFSNLSDLLLNSPFSGADLDLARSPDHPRPIDIE
jgi:Arc/MetJ-type ribon-helix-helix transcriptional regulator